MTHEVKDAFIVGDTVIVLPDPDADPGRTGQFQNLRGFDVEGKQLWSAELPTGKPSGVYTRIVSRSPLQADTFSSFECEIDLASGRIVRKEFFK